MSANHQSLRRAARTAALAALLAVGCRGGAARAPAAAAVKESAPLTPNQSARRLLCVDVGEDVCLSTCADDAPPREHAECLLALRLHSDPEALDLARQLYDRTNALVGIEPLGTIDGYRGDEVQLFPALPVGEHRHHLQWLLTSLEAFDSFVSALQARTDKPVTFGLRPRAFVFFRTAGGSYPSAYSWQGSIGYNLEGPLHTNARDVHETLFHELFHLNDEQRGGWSYTALTPIFDSIVERCGGADHECFTPFAPHGTVVPEGTYYAFDERTRDVREYAAELALRYFLEHEAVLSGGPPSVPAFKCLTAENRRAWSRLAEEFFGGADLTPECED